MTIVCLLHEGVCWLSVYCMGQVGSYLSDKSGMLSIIRQLLEADCRLSVRYLRQVGGYMSDI
jgi:hypothetical protein